jgi:hypothetical protein
MAETYKARWGIDWPAQMADELIDMTVSKKWKIFKEDLGVEFKDPWEGMLRAARSLLKPDEFRVSPWTEQHFHDFTMFESTVVWGCASSSKSNDAGLYVVLDFLVDPYDTVTMVGSTTLGALRSRTWEAIIRYFTALQNNTRGFVVPGKLSKVGFAIQNVDDASLPGSRGEKAGIQGRALNDGGTLQGAHLPHTRILIDELATIASHEDIRTAVTNLRVGTKTFKFMALANPASWDDPSCALCMPQSGQKVDVDTGFWISSRGVAVRHHDGLKSPVYLNPELKREFPFLMSQQDVADIVRDCDGNRDARQFWAMCRGFPLPIGTALPTVLDPLIASSRGIGSPPPAPMSGTRQPVGLAAGVDPAWSESGDAAVMAGCMVYEQDGRPILDFSGRVKRIPIKASSGIPVTQQQRDFVIQSLIENNGPTLSNLAVDVSGNQGIGDAISMYVGPGILSVNNSQRASELPVKATDTRRAKEFVKDRGTESWLVLAEFASAGQLYGLPPGAVQALTARRFAFRPGSSEPITPLRLEPKDEFSTRCKTGSPNETDACALAALAVKERMGILPFGSMPPPSPESVIPAAYGAGAAEPYTPPDLSSDYGADGCSGLSSYS